MNLESIPAQPYETLLSSAPPEAIQLLRSMLAFSICQETG